MSIKLNKPYKIVTDRLRRYEAYYKIPADRIVVIPLKELGDEVSCDIRWEDNDGQSQLMESKVFVQESLVPVEPLYDNSLYELWKRHHGIKHGLAK